MFDQRNESLDSGSTTSEYLITPAEYLRDEQERDLLKVKGKRKFVRSEYLANFGVQYNFTNMSIALLFLESGGVWYSEDKWGGNVGSVLKSIIFVGSIFGMCIFGFIGDIFGRNRAFTATSLIMVVFSLASAFAPSGSPGHGGDAALTVLACCRFFLGVGIGGCYPLSAAKSSEEGGSGVSVATRNFDVGMNLFWQGMGNVAPYAVAAVLSECFAGDDSAAAVWKFRLGLAVGALPPLAVLTMVWGAEESEEFKAAAHARRLLGTGFGRGTAIDSDDSSSRQQPKGSPRHQSFRSTAASSATRVANHFQDFTDVSSSDGASTVNIGSERGGGGGGDVGGGGAASCWCWCGEGMVRHLRLGFQDADMCKTLLATALAWGLYDVAYYGSSQFTPTMTNKVFHSGNDDDDGGDDGDDGSSSTDSVAQTAVEDVVATAVGIPAVLFALWCLGRIGTKRLAVWGFNFIALCCLALAACWAPLRAAAKRQEEADYEGGQWATYVLFALYVCFTFSVNWGPNVSTFVLPQEVFKVETRTTFNGISAAAGKVGAVLGIWTFEKMNQAFGIVPLMVLMAVLNFAGAAISQACISDELWRKQVAQQAEQRRVEAAQILIDASNRRYLAHEEEEDSAAGRNRHGRR